MDYWGVARTHIVTQSVWGYFWNDMPEKIKNEFTKKIDKTARKVMKYEKNLTPSLKVKFLFAMFKNLHLKGKMWEIDNTYWKGKFYEEAH